MPAPFTSGPAPRQDEQDNSTDEQKIDPFDPPLSPDEDDDGPNLAEWLYWAPVAGHA